MANRLIGGIVERDKLALVYCGTRVFIGAFEKVPEDASLARMAYAGEFICQREIVPDGHMALRLLVVGLGANEGPVRMLQLVRYDAYFLVCDEVLGAGAAKRVVEVYEKFLDAGVGDEIDRVVLPTRSSVLQGSGRR